MIIVASSSQGSPLSSAPISHLTYIFDGRNYGLWHIAIEVEMGDAALNLHDVGYFRNDNVYEDDDAMMEM